MNFSRLLDAHPIEPVQSNPNARGARTADREWRTSTFQAGMGVGVDTSVLVTEGEWDGCDVYVLPAVTAIKAYGTLGDPNAIYRFKVFAVVEGVGRTLVASALVSPGMRVGEDSTMTPLLAVQARGARCKYEVIVMYVGGVSVALNNLPVSFSLVASNDLAEADPFVGVSRSATRVIETIEQALPDAIETLGLTRDGSDWEIVSVHVANKNAAARSLLLFDLGPFGGPAANAVPALSFQVGPGDSRIFQGPFGMRFGRQGLHAGVSTDPTKYVAGVAGDLAYQVYLR